MIFSWIKRRRRVRLLAEPFPDEWRRVLERRVRHYRYLSGEERASLERRVKIFIAEKQFEGCSSLEMNDEIRVVIAAEACLMLLGTDEYFCFDGVESVLVYPSAFVRPADWNFAGGMVHEEEAMSGEAWHGGPVVLAWDDVRDGAHHADGHNLVIHEFAHQLDGLNGATDGVPPLRSPDRERRWYRVTGHEYERLVDASHLGEATLLDHYGASNEAEFFAVASECFFELPGEVRRRHPELYEVLADFYQLDPQAWFQRGKHAASA